MKILLLIIVLFPALSFSYSAGADADRRSKFIAAEAAYLNNDLFRAEYFFRGLIKGGVQDDITLSSMDRLVSMAEITGDKKLFEEISAAFKDIKGSSTLAYQSLLYAVGKYTLHDGNYSSSIKFMDRIDPNGPYYLKALYLKATCLGSINRFKEALTLFDRIIRSDSVSTSLDLRDLSIIGKARMLMVLKRYDKALVEYESINPSSPYYLKSLEEVARVFIAKKDYDQALAHLEALAFVNKRLYLPDNTIDQNTTLTDVDLMRLKTLQGYIYVDQNRFEDASQIFNEVILNYNFTKKTFIEELNRLKLSDDLAELLSYPNEDGSPKSVMTNIEYSFFGNSEPYSVAFRDWLTFSEKRELVKYLSIYFSLYRRVEDLKRTGDNIRYVAMRNLLNRYLKAYLPMLVKRVNARLDDMGLRAQLGKIDITWKTKENQSKKIKELQEKKQELLEEIDNKYRKPVE